MKPLKHLREFRHVPSGLAIYATLLAAPLPHLLQGQAKNQQLTVIASSVENRIITVDAQFNGRRIQLTCFKSDSDCALLAKGQYVVEVMAAGTGKYQDCDDVSVYKMLASGERAGKAGVYCMQY